MATIDRTHARPTAKRSLPQEAMQAPWPVLGWAAAGVVLLAFQIFVMARWVLGPNFKSTPPGPDQLPAWQAVVFTALQIGVPIAAVVLLYLLFAGRVVRINQIGVIGR
jgi:hypothetical protein